ncbi:potassium voltage-gated channel subfamily C member 1-like [Xenia sp. Carnegie-2017]|uniref:potassium voltage-gated channel subfamily C member 1-like n=1 Tax=Xenia sp. Carnegie-2017 TaxID=2897299 RepID=UPI001F0450C5|nr:potassium voltage-gated channel subfamily C member 1-like [Xenia sp. Carnegie-2017]
MSNIENFIQLNNMNSNSENNLRNNDRIILNVGGVRHETFISTIKNFPDTRLAWLTQRNDYVDYDPEKNEYFFDRHPGVFEQIINFYRTGKLHCPSDVCGPLFEEELKFWGIDEKEMEPCCWSTYTLHREAQKNLAKFNGPYIQHSNIENDPKHSKGEETGNENNGGSTTSSRSQRWRKRIWEVVDDHTSTTMSKVYIWISLVFVIISVISLCASTDTHVENNNDGERVIKIVDYVCGVWFTIEFIIRIATCRDIKKFSIDFLNWIDFLAIIPFYINITYGPHIVSEILALGRMLRLLRFFNKMSLGFQILKHTLLASSKEMLLLLLLVSIPVLIFAKILHICESTVSDTKFKSIPEAFWWAIITLTTVGYGDVSPLTTQGKIFGSICAVTSMLISALPISIIGANFSLYYRHAQARLKLPKKPRRILIGAANTLLQNDEETSEKGIIDGLTSEVYLGSTRRRERMSIFNGGTYRNTNGKRSGGENNLLEEATNHKTKDDSDSSQLNHKSSILSTSTKSTMVDSPPPRELSFIENPTVREKLITFDTGQKEGIENNAYNEECKNIPARMTNGTAYRSMSAGSRYKCNGIIHRHSAPRVMITAEVNNDNEEPIEQTSEANDNGLNEKLNVPSSQNDERSDFSLTAIEN